MRFRHVLGVAEYRRQVEVKEGLEVWEFINVKNWFYQLGSIM